MDAARYIISIIKWILIALATILLVGLLLGYRIYILESDSMSPKYPKGSVVVLDSKTKVDEIEEDDVIGLMVGNSLVFHRVVGTPASTSDDEDAAVENEKYRLAGDRDPDKWTEVEISNSNLLGKLVFSIPALGAAAGLFIGRGWIGWVAAGLILIGVLVPWKRLKRVKVEKMPQLDFLS